MNLEELKKPKDIKKEEEEILKIVDMPRERKSHEVLSQEELDELVGETIKNNEEEEKKIEPTPALNSEQKKRPKTLTPEIIQKIYNRFNNFEKILVFSSDTDFMKWLDEYEKKLRDLNAQKILDETKGNAKDNLDEYDNRERDIGVKIAIIKNIHRLVEAKHPLATLVTKDSIQYPQK